MPTQKTKDVAVQQLSREVLSDIDNVDDATRALAAIGISIITSVPAIGDGFGEVTKDSLVGIPFLIVTWEVREGEIEKDDGSGVGVYVGIKGIEQTSGRKFYIADGSELGLMSQLLRATAETGQSGGLYAQFGLDYFTTKKYGKRTYFIAKEAPKSNR